MGTPQPTGHYRDRTLADDAANRAWTWLYLAVEDVDHSRTKTKSPQTNGIVERFHKTVLNEFYRVAFRKRIYGSIAELQEDLDEWIRSYNPASQHPSIYVIEEKRFC